jgi:O-antigen/teichoic acid export membrane protein
MTQLDRSALREATLAGVRAMTVAKVASEVVLLVSTIALARMIAPSEFGLAAIALIVFALATVLTGEAFGTPLVQRKEVRPEHGRAALAMSLAFGAALTGLTLLVAPFCDVLFGEGSGRLIELMAPAFLIASVGVVPHATLQRRLDFRRLGTVEVANRIGTATVSVALALAGWEAEAILVGCLAGSALSSALLFASAPSPWPGIHRGAMREIAGFGVPAALSGLLRAANRNVDYAILGARLGALETGLYWRAFQFGVEYQSKISSIMTRIALPVYSRAESLDDMRALRARIVRVHATVLFPLLALLIALAPEALPWLLGPAWEPAVVPTQILAVAGMTAALMTGVGPLMLALGRPKALLHWNLLAAIAYGVMVYFVAPLGITAVCIAVVCMRVTTVVIAQLVLLRGLAGIPFRHLLDDAGPATIASAALLAASVPLAHWLAGIGAPVIFTISLVSVVGAAVYSVALRALFPAAWADVLVLARRILPARRRASAAAPSLEAPAATR